MTERTDLQKMFPGHWDGGDAEFHGRVRAKGSDLQIECMKRDDRWSVSVFIGGETTAATDDEDVRKAIAMGLKETLRNL